MTFFFDKCTSPNIVGALRQLGESNVVFHTEELASDADDAEDLIPHCSAAGYVLVSRDEKMTKRLAQRTAILTHGIGAFFLRSGELGRWRRFVQVVRAWEKMQDIAGSAGRPFAFIVGINGDHFTPVPLTG